MAIFSPLVQSRRYTCWPTTRTLLVCSGVSEPKRPTRLPVLGRPPLLCLACPGLPSATTMALFCRTGEVARGLAGGLAAGLRLFWGDRKLDRHGRRQLLQLLAGAKLGDPSLDVGRLKDRLCDRGELERQGRVCCTGRGRRTGLGPRRPPKRRLTLFFGGHWRSVGASSPHDLSCHKRRLPKQPLRKRKPLPKQSLRKRPLPKQSLRKRPLPKQSF